MLNYLKACTKVYYIQNEIQNVIKAHTCKQPRNFTAPLARRKNANLQEA